MKGRIALLIGVGLLAWLLGLVATFPADRALAWFAPPGVEAAGVSGTVWRGRAGRIDPGGGAPLEAVHWDIALVPLMTGQVAADTRFRVAGLEGEGRFARSPGGRIDIDGLALSGDAGGLGALLPGVTLELGGDLIMRLEAATVADGRVERLQGRLQWSGAAVTAPVALELGRVRGEVEPLPDRPGYALMLEGADGALDIGGGIELRPDGRYQADLRLTPTDQAPDGLRETLGMMAQRNDDTFRIRRDGRLPLPGGS